MLAVMSSVLRNGGKVVFDKNYRHKLWPSVTNAFAVMREALSNSDIALITVDDHMAIQPGLSQDEVERACFELPCSEVVLKRGGLPTLVRAHAQAIQSIEVEQIQPVDSKAAGDSFAAGYLMGRLNKVEPHQAAKVGNALAKGVIQHPGH